MESAAKNLLESAQVPEISGVFRGRELTRKDRRLAPGLPWLEALLDGGIPRGRITEITCSSRFGGKTSLTASFLASATQAGEVAAIVDLAGAFDPATMAGAGVALERVLWVNPQTFRAALRATELIIEAGGFGLIVLDLGEHNLTIRESAALRFARLAERSGSAVMVIAPRRACGTFAALSIAVGCERALFSRRPAAEPRRARGGGGPALFEGLQVRGLITRNKLGGSGASARWFALSDLSAAQFTTGPGATASFPKSTANLER